MENNTKVSEYQNCVKDIVKNDLLPIIENGYKYSNDGLAWHINFIEHFNDLISMQSLTGLVSDYKTDYDYLRNAIAGEQKIDDMINELKVYILFCQSALCALKADNYEQAKYALDNYNVVYEATKKQFPNSLIESYTTYDLLEKVSSYVKNENTVHYLEKWMKENYNNIYLTEQIAEKNITRHPTLDEIKSDIIQEAYDRLNIPDYRKHYSDDWYDGKKIELNEYKKEMNNVIDCLKDKSQKEYALISKKCGFGRDAAYDFFEVAFGHSDIPNNYQIQEDDGMEM